MHVWLHILYIIIVWKGLIASIHIIKSYQYKDRRHGMDSAADHTLFSLACCDLKIIKKIINAYK